MHAASIPYKHVLLVGLMDQCSNLGLFFNGNLNVNEGTP